MKTPTKRATRRLAASLAIIAALATGGAWAATTTYYQAKNWEGPSELSHGQDGTDIGYTPQLAFPGITIDDIPVGATFYTTIYGSSITTQYKTSVGMHETRCDTNGDGHADKMALQFAIHDGSNNKYHMKCVILLFTNVEGEGVHVQKFCQFYIDSQWIPNTKYFAMDSSGNITKQNSPSSWDESATSYCASGLWTHGISLANMIDGNAEEKLVFRGTTLKQLKGSSFMAGYRFGRNLEKELAEANDEATFVTNWPSDDNIQKIVMQFRARGTNQRTAIIELTEANGNVYAKHVLSCYNGAADTKYFSIDENGTVSLVSGTCTSYANGAYPVHDFYVQHHPRVPKTPSKIKVFSDPSKTLTLDDIQYGDFTARMCGGWIGASFRETHNTGYNKKVYNDETSGSVTNIVVEFQVRDGNYTKCLVVSFTNGEGGIYAEAINARYSGDSIGYQYRDYNGALHGNQNDKSGESVAETLTANGYGAFDLRVTMRTIYDWTLDANKNWSTLRNGATLASDEVVRITVTGGSKNHTLTVDEDVDIGQIRFVDGSAAILKVAAGCTLEADSITGLGFPWVDTDAMFYVDSTLIATSLKNDGTVVKRVADDVYIPVHNGSAGTTIVNKGTLKVSKIYEYGSGTTHTIRVASGARFDMNGVQDVTANIVLENGATFANTGAAIDHNKAQAVSLTLEGNATAAFSNDFGLIGPGHGATTLELGSKTLTLNGSNKNFWLSNTTITGGGTIYVEHGWLHPTKTASGGAACTLNIPTGGGLNLEADLTVANFVNGANDGNIKGSSILTVTGQLTPGSAAIPKLTLASGASIKASATKSQTVSTTFSASGTVTIDASEITKEQLEAGNVAVLTVPSSFNTSSAEWNVSSEQIAGIRAKWKTDGTTKTLYVGKPTGLIVIFR